MTRNILNCIARCSTVILGLMTFCTGTSIASAELTPNQVGVLVVSSSPESRQVAEYFASVRNIPADNILMLPIAASNALSRSDWDTGIRPMIRSWLNSSVQRKNIRCLVTTYGCPLVVGAEDALSDESQKRRTELEQLWQEKLQKVAVLISLFNSLGAQEQAPIELLPIDTNFKQASDKLELALKGAQGRLKGLAPADQKRLGIQLQKIFLISGGVKGVLQNLTRQNSATLSESLKVRQQIAAAELKGMEYALAEFQLMRGTSTRDWLMARDLERLSGTLGVLQWIELQLNLIKQNETMAAFDSELMLIHLPDHALERWLPNPLFYATRDELKNLPVMMVARLEAPSVELIKKRIDEGIATEKAGLQGTIYLDARSNRIEGNFALGSYEKCDQSICQLAQRLKNHTSLKVVLDTSGALFEPGSCPDTAMYAGWYALAHYIPAFTWNPGSVGYHLASQEGNKLRQAGSSHWCTAILENGGCSTVGPVAEPYLSAFPMPDDMFSLILTGKFTICEAYTYSTPFVSWMMIYVGDPLYNPYKNNAPLSIENLPEELKEGLDLR